MKKFLSFGLALVLILSVFSTTAIFAANAVTSGDYTYTETENGLVINKYSGSDTVVTVPAQIDSKNVYSVGEEAFFGSKVTDVIVSEGIKVIGSSCFERSISLKSITLPSTLETIWSLAFNQCVALEAINIPKNVSSIKSYAFRDCDKLSTFTVDENNPNLKSVDNVVYSRDGKTLVLYPSGRAGSEYTVIDGTETIASNSFIDTVLTAVHFPDSLLTISSKAFSESKLLTAVVLPENVTSIGTQAFSSCSVLSSVTIPHLTERIGDDAFKNCSANLTITGKTGSYAEKYAANNSITFISNGDITDSAQAVILMISELGEITLESETAITAARQAYENLETATLRNLITNYHILLCAEKKLAVLKDGGTYPEFTVGDLTDDGKININDVVALRLAIISGEYSDETAWAGDLNADGTLTVSDVVYLRKLLINNNI